MSKTKTILCYGDSLTWGAVPGGVRHAYEDRWPSVLNEELGLDRVRVFNESLGGRTTVFDDFSVAANRNGAQTLPTVLDMHMPMDLLIFMLGTNDLKKYVCGNVTAITRGMGRLIEIAQNHQYFMDISAPRILVVSPPHCVQTDEPVLSDIFVGAIEKSKEFAEQYEALALQYGCGFFDAAKVAKASTVDGIHLDTANTRLIGKNIAPTVAKFLNT
ncbi:MAG: SGNH/GDSL hydrolase family protein [Devosiaceae bacterium]|nr:SGNH/GDSL hydrolase family protein [Devosiaceae bacterium]